VSNASQPIITFYNNFNIRLFEEVNPFIDFWISALNIVIRVRWYQARSDNVNSIIGDISTILYLITIRCDLDTITLILHQTFELPPFKRDYDSAFEKVADILKRYGIVESARNLRFRFILCMQEFFDSIPEEQWKTKDPAFIKESEEFSINKFREWIIEQIT
jgi:hypothetical protein